jgi:hypothetical protein
VTLDARTIPNVQLMTVGTWRASTGKFTVTVQDLAAAVAAQDDPSYQTPVLKIGHSDPRFDGQPALGRVINLRLSADKHTLVGDIVGIPAKLAEVIPLAWPARSVEATFGLQTQTGNVHRFALTALSLLGAVEPAVGVLADVKSLADVLDLYGLQPETVAAALGGAMSDEPEQVRAALSLDAVRAAFYGSEVQAQLGAWAWVRDPYAGNGDEDRFLVVDDDEGRLWRVPWSEGEDGSVVFGEPTPTAAQYVDVAAAAAPERGSLRAAILHGAAVPHPEVEAAAIAAHSTPTTTGAWDGGVASRNLPNSGGAANYRRAFAWVDPSADSDTKSAYKFPHHAVSQDGTVGAANTTACSAGIAVLNGGRGGSSIPDADRRGVYNHLAQHLRDAGAEPPELQASSSSSFPPAAAGGSLREAQDGSLTAAQTGERTEMQLDDDQRRALCSRLGIPPDSDDEAIAAALAAPPPPPPEAEEQVAAASDGPHTGPGVIVDPGVLAELQASARRSDDLVKRMGEQDRDRVIAAARRDGKISAAAEAEWVAYWNRNPDLAKREIEAMPRNLIPVRATGYVGDPGDMDAEDDAWYRQNRSIFPPDDPQFAEQQEG